MSEWRPIETAPEKEEALFWIRGREPHEQWTIEKDENPVNTRGFIPHVVIGIHRSCYSSLWIATHWMPLPSAPPQVEKP
jgi:hypothetical protein